MLELVNGLEAKCVQLEWSQFNGRKSWKDMLHQTNRVETIKLNLTKIVCRVTDGSRPCFRYPKIGFSLRDAANSKYRLGI